jgi:hypothetical protein
MRNKIEGLTRTARQWDGRYIQLLLLLVALAAVVLGAGAPPCPGASGGC